MRPGLSDILWGRPETLKEVGTSSGVEFPPTFLDSLYKDAGTRNKGRLRISRLDHLPWHLVLDLAIGQCSPLCGWFCSPGDTSSSVGWEVLVDDVTVRTVEETVKTIVTCWVCPCIENLTSFKSVPRSRWAWLVPREQGLPEAGGDSVPDQPAAAQAKPCLPSCCSCAERHVAANTGASCLYSIFYDEYLWETVTNPLILIFLLWESCGFSE